MTKGICSVQGSGLSTWDLSASESGVRLVAGCLLRGIHEIDIRWPKDSNGMMGLRYPKP